MIELSIVFFLQKKTIEINYRFFECFWFCFFFSFSSWVLFIIIIIVSLFFHKNNGIHGQMLNHRNGSLVSNFFIIVWLSMKKKQYNQSINEPLATNRSRFNFFFFLSLIISCPLPNQIIFFFVFMVCIYFIFIFTHIFYS